MKKRVSPRIAIFIACVCVLSGCTVNNYYTSSETEELKQMVYDLTEEVATLKEMLALPEDYLTGNVVSISDDEGEELDDLFEVQEKNLLDVPSAGTKVNVRDWSKYAVDSSEAGLSEAELAFYGRLYAICEQYLNDPTHMVAQSSRNYISSNKVYFSDLGLTYAQADNVFWWFKFNNPEFYFLSNYSYTSTAMYLMVYDFVAALDDQAKTTNELFDKLDSWIAECSDDEVTTWDKVISANKKICENIIYSPAVKAGDDSAAGGKNQSMYSVLMTDDTVCAGYALTFNAMANAMDIDTFTVLSEVHAWNVARFDDGKYYFVDVCWNDEDNGYNENFLGVGTDYATYRDNGSNSHTLEDYVVKYGPSIPANNYEVNDNIGKIGNPALRVGGSGSNIVKVGWDAIANAEKYEYSVFDDTTVYTSGSTTDNYVCAILPGGVNSAAVKVRAIGSVNGEEIYSQFAEITVTPSNSGSMPNKPGNVTVEHPDGITLKWDADNSVDGWLIIGHGEDSTFTQNWIKYTLEKDCNSIGWAASWQPEEYTYFSVMSIKRSDNTETYSDPVYLKYNIHDGMKLLMDSEPYSDSTYVTQVYSNGVYDGEIVNGKRNGQGKYAYDSGNVYEGEWKDGKKAGQGKFTWADGSVYEGEWKDDERNGQGKLTLASGTVKEGEFKDGILIKGTMIFNLLNGVYTYESDNFIDGKMNGQSTRTIVFTIGDISILSGIATDDEISGEGTLAYTWADGGCFYYEGELKNGEPKGQGIKTTYFTGGTRWVEIGEFNIDLYNGTRTLYNADGSERYAKKIVNGKED